LRAASLFVSEGLRSDCVQDDFVYLLTVESAMNAHRFCYCNEDVE
jgi:hypothetical protein